MNDQAQKQRKPTRADKLADLIRESKALGVLTSPAQLADSVAVPTVFAAALVTGRPQLIKLAKPQPLTEEECRNLYQLIGTLIQTNMILVEHAKTLGIMVGHWSDHFKGLSSLGRDIEAFADFRSPEPADDTEELS